MNALGTKHSITKHFTAQLELEISVTGLATEETLFSCSFPEKNSEDIMTPRIPMSGLIHGRQGKPMTADELQIYSSRATNFNNKRGSPDKPSPDSSKTDSTDTLYDADAFPQPARGPFNTPGVIEPPRHVSSFPSFTPMLPNVKIPFAGIDLNSKLHPDQIPRPPEDEKDSSTGYKFPFRQGPTFPGNSADWSQSQPQPEAQPRPRTEAENFAFNFTNSTWFPNDSLLGQPTNPDLDALLVGTDWDGNQPTS
jgi:hypothetical protein